MSDIEVDKIWGGIGQSILIAGDIEIENPAFLRNQLNIEADSNALLPAQNLADLGDFKVARNNLSVLPFLPDAHFSQTYAGFVYSGTFPTGIITRALNTTHRNIIGAILSGNQINLPEGTYYVKFRAAAMRVDTHKAYLRNVTTGVTVLDGSGEHSNNANGGNNWSDGEGVIVVTSVGHSFAIRHQCNASSGNEYGQGIDHPSSEAPTHTYTDIKIWKVT